MRFLRGHHASKGPHSAVSGKAIGISLTALLRKFQSRPRRIKARNVFPRILDKYVVREFLIIFALVLAGFCHAHTCLHRFSIC